MKINRLINLSISLLAVTSLFISVVCHASSSTIRISQVYGGGGNAGAVYKNDFIELYNASNIAENITGWSVQYASAAGTSWTVVNLSGFISGGSYYLIQLAPGSGGTTNLPTPDLTDNTLNLSSTAGKVALVNNTTVLSGSCPTGVDIIDFVGYGSLATCSESSPAPAPDNTNSIMRLGNGCIDTDNNATDFQVGTASPRNSFSISVACVGVGIKENIEEEEEPAMWTNGEVLYIDFSNFKSVDATVNLFDLTGKLLKVERIFNQGIFGIALNKYSSSFVIISLLYKDHLHTKKLILLPE